ncbi:glycosyltransferase family 25 protein [Trematosphaeria pertusa]|uniref:Glycosyltransferase family 25 protein n=1 Tax=Trematosphaeria pertusa TaxID=390896 RepID=A0A6A6I7F6_9PLEO|nr:glycosyltransferase family 25 protein [Trematosphaeria pertusa]KAF2246237.1 glycosyltransferase family 25 protein [Trematosphaeria pertusa]
MALRVVNAKVLSICTLLLIFLATLAHFFSSRDGPHVAADAGSRLVSGNHQVPYVPSNWRTRKAKPANATLDFQEILYISMPYRTDRQDAMSLLAAATGLKVTLIPGVDVSTMHPKAKPLLPFVDPAKANDSFLGVWRAHANAWRHIIDHDVATALILEDDVDWDVHIKDIMGLWSFQLRYNNSLLSPSPSSSSSATDKSKNQECPYGCAWDELYMGQCGNTPNPDDRRHQVYADPHSPAVSTHTDPIVEEMTQHWNVSRDAAALRIISPTYGPLCAMGYAVTRLGAMRMLYQIGGWRGFGMGVDNEIAFRTQEGRLRGWTLSPPCITAWRTGGARDSDNDGDSAERVDDKGNAGGFTRGLKESARKAMERLLGETVDRRVEELLGR